MSQNSGVTGPKVIYVHVLYIFTRCQRHGEEMTRTESEEKHTQPPPTRVLVRVIRRRQPEKKRVKHIKST